MMDVKPLKGTRCRAPRDRQGYTEGTIQHVIDNLDRRLITVPLLLLL